MHNTDTIVAQATATGKAGIGIVRVSGPLVNIIAKKVLKKKIKARYAFFLPFYDVYGNIIDKGIALLFKAPDSFTGEDVLELQGHGGPIILDTLIQTINEYGARLAQPGEFTKRAFLNEKIDLLQAEAIADLINSSSEKAARCAIQSLQGQFSAKIYSLLEKMIKMRMFIESAIDFPEEEIDFIDEKQTKQSLQELQAQMEAILKETKQGVILQEGIKVAIVGKPNAGKSSILNLLTAKDSAIVTSIAGTTRDVIKETINIKGIGIQIMDTAGLHQSNDEIEKIGMNRSITAMAESDLILFVVDSMKTFSFTPDQLLFDLFDHGKIEKKVIFIFNKIDLIDQKAHMEKKDAFTLVYMSAKKRQDLDLLKEAIANNVEINEECHFIARRRHLEAIEKAKKHIDHALNHSLKFQAYEILAEDLRLAQNDLNEITGKFTSDDLLGKIFSEFCIGK